MSQPSRADENRCVFSAHIKAFCDSAGAHTAGGTLFQVVSPLTAKLRCPSVDRMYGTSRVRLDADRNFSQTDVAVALCTGC